MLLVFAPYVCAATTGAEEAAELSRQGGDRFRAGDYTGAIEAYRGSDRLVPLTQRHRFTLAMALIAVDDHLAARSELEALPRSSLVLYWLGRLATRRNNLSEAVALHTEAVAADPSSVKALDGLGLAYQASGDFARAVETFRRAINLDQTCSPWPRHNLATLLLEQKRDSDASDFAREAVRCSPTFAPAEYLLGRVDERAGRVADALTWYQKAIEHDPRLRSAVYALARLYGKLGEVEKQESLLAQFRSIPE